MKPFTFTGTFYLWDAQVGLAPGKVTSKGFGMAFAWTAQPLNARHS